MSADARNYEHVAMGEAEAVMRKMVEMFATGDVSGVDDVVSAEYHDHQGLNAAARLCWLRVSEAGERIERETLDIVRIRDGKAVEHWGASSVTEVL